MCGINNLKSTNQMLQQMLLLMAKIITGSWWSAVLLHNGMKPVRLTKSLQINNRLTGRQE